MDPEATLSSTESSHRTDFVIHSLLAFPMTFQGKRPAIQAGANKISAAHYTEEHLTIPETPPSWVPFAFQNTRFLMKRAQEHLVHLLLPVNPVQTDAGGRVLVS